MTSPMPAQFDAISHAAAALSCPTCGYNLTGLAAQAPCPECGRPAGAAALAAALGRPKWLRALRAGVLFVLAGRFFVALWWTTSWGWFGAHLNLHATNLSMLACWAAADLALFAGLWVTAGPEWPEAASPRRHGLTRIIRLIALAGYFAPVAAYFLVYLDLQHIFQNGVYERFVSPWLEPFLHVAGILFTILILQAARRLGLRRLRLPMLAVLAETLGYCVLWTAQRIHNQPPQTLASPFPPMWLNVLDNISGVTFNYIMIVIAITAHLRLRRQVTGDAGNATEKKLPHEIYEDHKRDGELKEPMS